jgi:UDP-glucose 4-epimerase
VTRPSVLVTGAAGYVGRLTIDALVARAGELERIVALDVVEVRDGDRRGAVAHVVGDVSEFDLGGLMRAHAIDTVVHLASIVRAPPGAPADLAYRVDVLGTRNVLDACVATGVRKLVVTTSGAAYGYHADNPRWIDEDDPLRGNETFPYAHHKKLVESMLATCRQENPGLSQMVLRPGTVIGEGTRSPVTDLFDAPAILGVWGSRSPFVFIWDRDVVEVILLGVLEGRQGVYNLAGDGVLTAHEIARRLHKPYVPLPAPVLRAALWALHALGRTSHGPEQVDFLRYRPVLSNRRLKEELGFQPVDSSTAFGKWADARASKG